MASRPSTVAVIPKPNHGGRRRPLRVPANRSRVASVTTSNGVWPILLGLALSLLGHFATSNVADFRGDTAFRGGAPEQPLSAAKVDAAPRVIGASDKPWVEPRDVGVALRGVAASRALASYPLASTPEFAAESSRAPELRPQRQRAPPHAHG